MEAPSTAGGAEAGRDPGRAPRPQPRRHCLAGVGLALVLLLCGTAGAEEGAGMKLVPKPVPDIEKGTAAIVKGTAGPEGQRFYIEYLSMLQPVSVVLMAPDPERPLKLNLSKYRFDQSDRSGITDREGAVAFHFRTQGELKILVTPADEETKEETPYYLIAWVGDEFVPDLRPPVVLASADAGGAFPWKWLAIGLLGLMGLGAVFWLGRRSA